jgi:hypothetical protein
MKTYRGDRTIDGVVVEVDGQDLQYFRDVKQFSNAAFEWGFEGQAATQLAFALLYDHTRDKDRSIRLAKPFMQQVTANFGNEWEMTSADIDVAINQVTALAEN